MRSKMEMDDKELVEKLKEYECEDSLKELIQRHSALCYSVYYKYSGALASSGVNFTEALKEKDFVIYKAAKSYKADKKAKFSTWLGNYTRYHCLNLMNDKRNYICVEDKDLHYHIDKQASEEAPVENLKEIREYVRNILSQLRDGRIKKVFELRYFSSNGKATWNTISKKMHVSIQTVINLHSRGAKILRKKIHSEEYKDMI
jgi:RNA polymerase sigma factor (sigma-70 family)